MIWSKNDSSQQSKLFRSERNLRLIGRRLTWNSFGAGSKWNSSMVNLIRRSMDGWWPGAHRENRLGKPKWDSTLLHTPRSHGGGDRRAVQENRGTLTISFRDPTQVDPGVIWWNDSIFFQRSRRNKLSPLQLLMPTGHSQWINSFPRFIALKIGHDARPHYKTFYHSAYPVTYFLATTKYLILRCPIRRETKPWCLRSCQEQLNSGPHGPEPCTFVQSSVINNSLRAEDEVKKRNRSLASNSIWQTR